MPTEGQFYPSSDTHLAPAAVDDRLLLSVNGGIVFSHNFSNLPIGTIVSLETAVVNQMAGQTVTVIYQDIYGDQQGATAVWLIWLP